MDSGWGEKKPEYKEGKKAEAGRGILMSVEEVWREGQAVHQSTQDFDRLDEAHSPYGRQPALLKVNQFKC